MDVHTLDRTIDEIWAVASNRGYRVSVPEVMAARRQNPRDSMSKQILANLKHGSRVHPRTRACGAVTGRMSMSGPNLQGMSPAYRRCLLAERGMVLVGCDLNRFEPTIAAALSGDEVLTAAVQPGREPYLELASAIYGEVIPPDDPRRGIAKTALLATLYGEGATLLATSIAGRAPTPQEVAEAKRIRAGVLAAYPQLARWVAGLRAKAAQGEPIITRGGRTIRVAAPGEPDAATAYRAVAYMVQGSAADYFKRVTVAVHEACEQAGLSEALWLPIHDELVLQVTPGRADEARQLLERQMSKLVDGVRVYGEAKILGANFGK